jgi:hypothetical protein
MELKAGMRLRNAASSAELIVVAAPDTSVTVTLGGVDLVDLSTGPDLPDAPAATEGALVIGKRYVDETAGAEFLCIKAGPGELCIDDRTMSLKEAKALPSSD